MGGRRAQRAPCNPIQTPAASSSPSHLGSSPSRLLLPPTPSLLLQSRSARGHNCPPPAPGWVCVTPSLYDVWLQPLPSCHGFAARWPALHFVPAGRERPGKEQDHLLLDFLVLAHPCQVLGLLCSLDFIFLAKLVYAYCCRWGKWL